MKTYVIKICQLLVGVLLVAGQGIANPLYVTTSFSILSDLVLEVGGDLVKVNTVVGPEQELHGYQLTPSDIQRAQASQLILMNGLGFDDTLIKGLSSQLRGISVYTLTDGINPLKGGEGHQHHGGHDHDDEDEDEFELDPHAWQNPLFVKIYIKNIVQALSMHDPQHAQVYSERAQAYMAKLDALDHRLAEAFKQLRPEARLLITSHDAFAYFAQRYGLTIYGIQGMNPHASLSAKELAGIVTQIKTQHIRAAFFENLSNQKYIDQLARETGIKIGGKLYADTLSKRNTEASTYLMMMEHNASTMMDALK